MKTRLFLVSVAVSALCFGSGYAYADESLRLYGLSDVIPFNTLHTHLSLRPNLSPHQVSNQNAVQVAQVCWIMDTGECAGLDFVNSDINGDPSNKPTEDYDKKGASDCIKEGYKLTSCQSGYKGNKFCMYDNRYFAECIPDCPSDYKTCTSPYKGAGQVCGDGLYASCECDYCTDYPYEKDDIPEGYVADGNPCNSCNGPRYKVKPNPCDGYLDCGGLGGKAGAKTCLSGTVVKYSECKPCPNLGTYTTCPACSVCSYEQCSSKFYVTGCKTGCADYCDYCAFEQ